ncbi:MAG: hypothetical protein R8N23_10610 [Reichenbachiella sp.]|uniref:hypothetical protein n=1 Tax=Reichenbachiella sp. TaxID=2184521 RepID=UPI002966E5AE|nr:hypothetical protein [Reichenbachiella sp.]MDW3210310.1 hypothetical protein [Reichenbachiella sp.]
MIDIPDNFSMKGDRIHVSSDPNPHLTGRWNGQRTADHIPYHGQTTLGMFDNSLPGGSIGEVNDLMQKFPNTFNDSGLKW